MKNIFLGIYLILAIIYLGAGCLTAGDKTMGEVLGDKDLDPCSLVTQAKIDEIMEMPTKIIRHDTEASNADGQKICFYDAVDPVDAVVYVQISIQQNKNMRPEMSAEQIYQSLKKNLDKVADVKDLGNEAFMSQMDFVGGGSLYFLVNEKNTLVNIDVSLGNKDHAANQSAEQRIAKEVIQNL